MKLRLLLSFAAGWAAALPAAEPPVAPAPLRTPAPAAIARPIEGTLPNGLRYTLLPHRRDLARVSVRLVVHAGSLDEQDGERGFAHFVEHLAFEGSRHYPPGKVREFFQSLGVADGADLNAHTQFTHTLYKIDLPVGRTARFPEALRVLRDFADGVEFPAAEVARERGVILSERAARDDEPYQSNRQRLAARYPGMPFSARLPIGEVADLERATAGSLRAFYRRCYAPARMTLVVTGDIDPAAARQLIAEHFGTLRADRSSAPQVLPPEPTAADAPRAHIITAPSALAANFTLSVVRRTDDTTAADRRNEWVDAVALDALHRRLSESHARESTRFGMAIASRADGPDGRFDQFFAEAAAATDDWPAAVALIETELRRAITQGFAPGEVQEQFAVRLAWAHAAVATHAGKTPDELATEIAAATTAGIAWLHPAEIAAAAAEFAPTLTPAAVGEALRTLFVAERLQLLLTRHAPPAGGADAVLAAWHASAARALPPAAPPSAPLEFAYTRSAQPGIVASRHTEADLGIERVAFANGARLNLRRSPTEPGRFRLAVRIGRGLDDFPRDRPGLGHLAAHLFRESDLQRHTREEINRLLRLHALSAHATFDHRYLAEITGPVAELPFALRILAAEFSDSKQDPASFPQALSDTAGCRAAQLGNGADHAREGIRALMAGGDPRLQEPPPTAIGDYTYAEVVAWLRTHWLNGPIEVALAGDFDPEAAITAAAVSFGALPRLRDFDTPGAARPVLRSEPAHATQRETLGDATAAVRLAWPVGEATAPATRHALTLAHAILLDRLHHSLRQELGATYSPDGAILALPQHHTFAYATAGLTFAPDRAPALTRRALALADAFARGGATPAEFARLREPLRAGTLEKLRSNEWWLDHILAQAQSDPAVLAYARALAGAVERITLADVNRAAAAHYRADRASSLIVIPVAPAAAVEDRAPATAAEFIARGEAGHLRGDIAAAMADFDRAVALEPKNDDALLARSAARMQRGDVDGCIADTTRALELNPKNAMAYVNRAAAKLALGAFDAVIVDCSKAIEIEPKLAQAFSNRAGARLCRGDFDGCIADATKAIELNRRDAVAYINRGAAYANTGERQRALADCTTGIEFAPRNVDGWHNRGWVRQLEGNLEGALDDYDRALALNPAAVSSLRARGLLLQNKGRVPGALADYDKILALVPDDETTHLNRGIVRQQTGDLAGALADLADVLRVNPKNADAFNNRGFVRQTQRDYDAAIADYTQAIELRPGFAVAYNNRGQAKRLKGDTLGAMDDLDRGSRLGMPVSPVAAAPVAAPVRAAVPPSPATAALIQSANTKRAQRNLDGALADLDRAIDRDAAYPDIYVQRASLRLQKNDLTGALADTDRALTLRPGFAGAYLERGIVRRQQRDYAAALADLAQAIALDPKLSAAFFNRGLVHEARRDWRAAVADFDRALTLSPNHAGAYNARGYARQNQGDHDRAIADYTEAIARAASFSTAYFNRAVTHRMKGTLTAALADFDQLLALSPNYRDAHANRACVRAALGDFAGACADHDAAIKRSRDNRYSLLFRFLNQRRLQPDAPGADFARVVAAWPEDWMKAVGRHLLGEIDEPALFTLAKESAGTTPLTRASESNYFAGMKRLLDHDEAGARLRFEQSTAARQTIRFSHTLARAELARLRAAAPAP